MTVASVLPVLESVPHPAACWPEPDHARPIHVLLVEDNREHADWTTLLLSAEPSDCFKVECVSSLTEAMKRLPEPDVDVILLDLGMPELQGHRSHAAIRAVAPGIPVVILTSDDTYLSRDLAWSSGAQDYLLKNEISADQLRQALRRASQHRKRSG